MKNVRINTDQRFNLSLKAGGKSIDMTGIDVLSLYMYCNPQKARDGAIKHSVSTSDAKVLEMIWPADVQRYLGSHSVHGTIRYAGAVASFDIPAVNVVSMTSEADISTDTIVLEAPVGTEDLTATISIYGMGPKGDKMTYEDLTEADKEDIYKGGAEMLKPLFATKANIQHQHKVADITDFPELYYDATAFFTSGAYPSDKYEELLEAVKAKRTVYATIDEAGYTSYVFFVSSANSDGSSSRVLLTTIFADGSYLYLNTFVLQQSGMTTLQESITGKANKATTLAGYGIGDAYTKSELDALLKGKQSILTDTDGSYGQRVAELEKEGIASQEKLSELEREVIGGEKSSWVNINLVEGTNFFVGEYYNTGSPYANKTSAAGYSCAIIPCSKGDIIRLKGIGNASAVVRFFAIINNEYLILRKADGAISARENPYEITIEEDSAAYICVNFSGYDQNTDEVSIYETFVIEGLKTKLDGNTEILVPPSNKEVSHICLVYDDEYSQDLVDICDERGIKVTFALIGNVDKDDPYWKSSALAMRKAMKNGHGCAAHGIVRGWVPSSGGTEYGIDQMNDHDALQAINLENKAFDDYGLPHYGLVAFNSYEENPHCTKLVRSNYNYLLQFITADNIPSTTDLYQLGRLNTDLSSQINSIKSAIDVAIRNGLNVFIGGHFGKTGGENRRTGSGVGSYSTMAQFLSLLDYIKSYIDRGLLVSMSLDNAINDIWNSATNRSVVKKVNYNLVNPPLYAMKYDDGLKICSVRGAFYIFEMQVSGTPADGSFDLLIGGSEKSSDKSLGQTLTIATSSTDSIEDVVDNICSQIYKAFTPYKKSHSSIVLFRDIFGSSFVPEVSNNTSGLNFTISVSQYGKNEKWV